MHPILIEIAPLHVTLRSYPVFILLAVIVSPWLGPHCAAKLEGLDRSRTFPALLLIGLAVFVGARLHFVLTHWTMFSNRPQTIPNVLSGGIHAGGAIAFLVISAPLVLRWLRIPLGKFIDGFEPTPGGWYRHCPARLLSRGLLLRHGLHLALGSHVPEGCVHL